MIFCLFSPCRTHDPQLLKFIQENDISADNLPPEYHGKLSSGSWRNVQYQKDKPIAKCKNSQDRFRGAQVKTGSASGKTDAGLLTRSVFQNNTADVLST